MFLDPLAKQQITIGNALPAVTNTVATGLSPYYGGSGTSSYTRVTQPQENKMGFLVEFIADGVVVGSQSQPPDAKQRIRAIQGN